jgi:fucose permease
MGFVGFYMFLCLVTGLLGRHTYLGFWANFIFSLFFTPIFPLIYILVAGYKNNKEEVLHSK